MEAAAAELATAYRALHTDGLCDDRERNCADWAARGECEKNRDFMATSCRRACNLCGQTGKVLRAAVHRTQSRPQALPARSLSAKLLNETG